MNTQLKMICESEFQDLEILVEQTNIHEAKQIKIRGPYIVAEKKNGNGRVYPAEIIEKAVAKYTKDFIETNRSVGELNHPSTIEIDYNNACHMITSLKREGNLWIGESKILTGTPKGDLVAGLLQNGVKVGISTRGVGNINEKKVVDEYRMITADLVNEPSGPGCFLEGILESKSFMIDTHGDIIEYAYENLTENLADLPNRSDERKAKIVATLADFLQSI
jgi:hypothetical protein